jgi:MFS transporter, DHA3 family, macrolide efflux protein
MHRNVAAATSRKRSGLAAFDRVLPDVRGAGLRTVNRQPADSRPGGGVARCLTTFFLGSVANGAVFVLVAAALERRDVSPSWLAAIAAVRLAPYLMCSPVAGALAGRHEARMLFVVTGLARAALVVALWIGLGVGAPAAVLVTLLFVLVAAGTPTFPALMRAVRDTAGPARLDRTSALAAGLEAAAFGAGPALGGLLLLTGTTSSLLVCAATLAASAALATSLPTSCGTTRAIGGSRWPVRSAGRCLVRLDVRTPIVAVIGVDVLAGLNSALLVRLPTELELGGERAFGLLSVVYGVGAFSAFITLLGPIRRGRRPLLPLATAGAAIASLSATSDLSVAVIACGALGASILTAEVLVTGALGRSLPGALVAPAFGVLDALMVAAMVSGALGAPMLTAAFGLRATLAVAGIGTPLLAIGSLQLRRRAG